MSDEMELKEDKLLGVEMGLGLLLLWWVIIAVFMIFDDSPQGITDILIIDPLTMLLIGGCAYFIVKYAYQKDEIQTVREADSDLGDAAVGDVVEVSGTTVTDDSTDASLFGHDTPLIRDWQVEEGFRLNGETRWQTVESGQRTDKFLIQSDDGPKATINPDNIFEFENARADFGRQREKETVEPTEEMPPYITSFLRRQNIDVTEARNEEPGRVDELRTQHFDSTMTGTLRFTESRYLKNGEDLFVRGVLKNRRRTGPDEIGLDTDELCVIADQKRRSYIGGMVSFVYAAATFIIASLFFGVLAFFAANPSVVTRFL